MADLQSGLKIPVEILRPSTPYTMPGVLFEGDENANRITLVLMQNGEPADIGTVSVSGEVERADGNRVPCKGEQNGNELSIILNANCYNVPGACNIFVIAKSEGVERTLAEINANVRGRSNGAIVEVENVIPSIADILQRIDELEAAGIANVEAIEAKGQEVRESLPDDYTALAGEVSKLSEEIDKYNAINALSDLNRPNGTMYGVSYEWEDKDTCHFTSNEVAATSNSYCQLYNNKAKLPESVKPGKTYFFNLTFTGKYNGVRFNFCSYDSDGNVIENKNFSESLKYTVPSNAVGVRIAVLVIKDYIVDGTINVTVMNAYTNYDITHRVKGINNALLTEYTDFIEKRYIGLANGIGEKVDMAYVGTSTHKTAVIPCKNGDVFVLTGKGGAGNARLWGFTDKDYVLLSVADINVTATELELVAENDGYFITNVNMGQDNELLYFKNNRLSPYDKRNSVAIGNVPSNIYIGRHTDTTGLNLNSTYAAMIEEFDKLVDDVYVTKEDLGERSRFTSYTDPETGEVSGEAETGDLPHIYCYTIEPLMYALSPVDIPTVIISASVHGDEKSATYGMMYFIRDMMEHAVEDPVLMYMRSNIRFKVIPGANPWGWDKATNNSDYPLGRFNARGVNINRNFGASTWGSYDDRPGAWEYGAKGDSPFSEVETQYIRDVVLSNPNAVLYIDWHTNGRFNNSDEHHDVRNLFVGWVAETLKSDIYARKLINAAVSMNAMVKPFTDSLYEVNVHEYVYGSARFTDPKPTGYDWCVEETKIPAYLCETPPGSNVGYLGDKLTHYSADLIKYNAELFVNYLMRSLSELR